LTKEDAPAWNCALSTSNCDSPQAARCFSNPDVVAEAAEIGDS